VLSVPSPIAKSVSPEADLLLRVQGGDQSAFATIYNRWKGPILSYLFQLVRSQTLAEELMHDVFLSVYRAAESYRPEVKFSTWLWTIAHNRAIDHLRRKKELHLEDSPKAQDEGGMEQVESSDENAEEQLIAHADKVQIENAMGLLTPSQREALSLRVFSDMGYDEIAETMKTTNSSVKSLINRAKSALLLALRDALAGQKEEG